MSMTILCIDLFQFQNHHTTVCIYTKLSMRGLGKKGEFGHICVVEKNGFEVLDVGVRGDVWRDVRGWGGVTCRDMGWECRGCQRRVSDRF